SIECCSTTSERSGAKVPGPMCNVTNARRTPASASARKTSSVKCSPAVGAVHLAIDVMRQREDAVRADEFIEWHRILARDDRAARSRIALHHDGVAVLEQQPRALLERAMRPD